MDGTLRETASDTLSAQDVYVEISDSVLDKITNCAIGGIVVVNGKVTGAASDKKPYLVPAYKEFDTVGMTLEDVGVFRPTDLPAFHPVGTPIRFEGKRVR